MLSMPGKAWPWLPGPGMCLAATSPINKGQYRLTKTLCPIWPCVRLPCLALGWASCGDIMSKRDEGKGGDFDAIHVHVLGFEVLNRG